VIHRDSLNGLINLKSLLLDANQIEIIEADSFEKLIKLELLDLHYNWIRSINIKALINKLKNLKEINLNKNPIEN
jgi:Leucine-rich repeat (LRR) protein